MVNSEDFSKRLQKIIDYHGESASSFAEKIGVQRSSISHVLSGRNKPSLEFVLKITTKFKDVDLYWLLNGKGSFPKESENSVPKDLFSEQTTPLAKESNKEKEMLSKKVIHNKTISRIVIFYSDGSFENFEN